MLNSSTEVRSKATTAASAARTSIRLSTSPDTDERTTPPFQISSSATFAILKYSNLYTSITNPIILMHVSPANPISNHQGSGPSMMEPSTARSSSVAAAGKHSPRNRTYFSTSKIATKCSVKNVQESSLRAPKLLRLIAQPSIHLALFALVLADLRKPRSDQMVLRVVHSFSLTALKFSSHSPSNLPIALHATINTRSGIFR